MITFNTANQTFLYFVLLNLFLPSLTATLKLEIEIVGSVFVGLSAWFLYNKFRSELQPMFTRITTIQAALAALVGVGLFSIDFSVIQTLGLTEEISLRDTYTITPAVAIAFSFLSSAITTPMWEEIAFRGVVTKGYSLVFSRSVAVLLSTTLFAIGHLNPLQAVFVWIAGIIFARLVVRTNALWMGIIAHGISNFLSVLFNLIGYPTIAHTLPQKFLFSALAVAIFVALLFLTHLKQSSSTASLPLLLQPLSFKSLRSPPLILGIAVCLASFSLYLYAFVMGW
jgi:membrane protease YdiL (CAAX protease family)